MIGAAFTIVGGIITWVLIPDKERDLGSEDHRFRTYLEEHGFDTSCYGESFIEDVKTTAFKV